MVPLGKGQKCESDSFWAQGTKGISEHTGMSVNSISCSPSESTRENPSWARHKPLVSQAAAEHSQLLQSPKFIENEKVKHIFNQPHISNPNKEEKITLVLKKSSCMFVVWNVRCRPPPSLLLFFLLLLFNWPIFQTWRRFFTLIKNSLTEICLSLTRFLYAINLIAWLTGCFVYCSYFFR